MKLTFLAITSGLFAFSAWGQNQTETSFEAKVAFIQKAFNPSKGKHMASSAVTGFFSLGSGRSFTIVASREGNEESVQIVLDNKFEMVIVSGALKKVKDGGGLHDVASLPKEKEAEWDGICRATIDLVYQKIK